MADITGSFVDSVKDWYTKAIERAKQDTRMGVQILGANAEAAQKAIAAGATWAAQGPGQTVKALTGFSEANPWEAAKGAAEGVGDFAGGLVTHAAQQTNGLLQTVIPGDLNNIPGMKGVFPPKPQGISQQADTIGRNVPVLSDLASPAIAAVNGWQRSMDDLAPDATLGQRVQTGLPAAIAAGAAPLLAPFKELATGKDAAGKPLTTRTAVPALGNAAMIVGMAKAGASAAGIGKPFTTEGFTKMLEGETSPKELLRTRSIGEIEATGDIRELAKNSRQTARAEAAGAVKGGPQAVEPPLAGTPPAAEGVAAGPEDPFIRDENGQPLMRKGTEAPDTGERERIGPMPGTSAMPKPLWEHSPEELDVAAKEAKSRDKQDLVDIFGKEGAAEYSRQYRISNSSIRDFKETSAASDKVSAMEESLSEEQRNKLFGIGDTRHTAEDIQQYRQALGAVDTTSPEALSDSLKYAITKVGTDLNPDNMSVDQQVALAQLRHGFQTATEQGWDTRSITANAAKAAFGRFSDPNDAATMMEGIQGLGKAKEQAKPVPQLPAPLTPAEQDTPALAPDAWNQLPGEFQKQFTIERQMPLDMFDRANQAVVTDPLARQAWLEHINNGDPTSLAAFKAFADPEVAKGIITDIVDTRGVDFSEAHAALLDSYERTKTYFGSAGASLSQTVAEFQDKLSMQARNGDFTQAKEAMKILKDLRVASEGAASRGLNIGGSTINLGSYQKVANILQKTEALRLSAMLTPIRTAFGIAESQFGLLGTDFMDAGFSALAHGLRDPIAALTGRGAVPTSTSAMADISGLWHGAVSRLTNLMPEISGIPALGRAAGVVDIDRVLNLVPAANNRLNQGLMLDTDAHLLGQSFGLFRKAMAQPDKGFGQRLGEGISAIADNADISLSTPGKASYNIARGFTDLLLTANRFQEQQFRKLAFDARYRANLEHAGMTWDGAIQELNRRELTATKAADGSTTWDVKPISPALRESIVDAEVHALRQTYAYNPEGGLFGALLKTNQQLNKLIPTSLYGFTFPRAVVNNVLWQIHHSPLGVADIFDGEAREAFLGMDKKLSPTAARNAARQQGQALTGLVLFSTAMHLANGGDINGWKVASKPTKLTHTSQLDEHGNPLVQDVSGVQPFNGYLAIADQMMAAANGRAPRLTADEFMQSLVGSRVDDIPLLGVQRMIQNWDSTNPNTEGGASRYVGQWLAGWAPLLKGFRDEYAVLPPAFRSVAIAHAPASPADLNSALNLDTKTGFARHYQADSLPDAFLAPWGAGGTLDKIDAATGQPDRENEPIRNLAHLNRRSLTPTEHLLDITPGYSMQNITKKYSDPHATMLFNKSMGAILNDPKFYLPEPEKTPADKAMLYNTPLQDIMRGLAKLNTPAVTHLMLDSLLPQIHAAAESMAMAEDAKANGGRPVHFLSEITASANLFKDATAGKKINKLIQSIQIPSGDQQ